MPEVQEEESGWKCLMQFLDGSPSFANGFNCGRHWELLKRPDVFGREQIITLATECQDQMLMMVSKLGWSVVKQEVSNEWITLYLELR